MAPNTPEPLGGAATGSVLRALADPTRRALFETLMSDESTVRALTDAFPVSQPAISQHLATLREAGLVSSRREGRCVFYRAEAAGLAPLFEWADRYRAFWPDRLRRLEAALEDME